MAAEKITREWVKATALEIVHDAQRTGRMDPYTVEGVVNMVEQTLTLVSQTANLVGALAEVVFDGNPANDVGTSDLSNKQDGGGV